MTSTEIFVGVFNSFSPSYILQCSKLSLTKAWQGGGGGGGGGGADGRHFQKFVSVKFNSNRAGLIQIGG